MPQHEFLMESEAMQACQPPPPARFFPVSEYLPKRLPGAAALKNLGVHSAACKSLHGTRFNTALCRRPCHSLQTGAELDNEDMARGWGTATRARWWE